LEKEEQIEEVKRSWFIRTFGKMEKGSLRISVFTLVASAMGTGLFGLPYIASQTGLIMVVIFILIGCAFSLTSMYLLMSVALPKGVKSYN
jgi:amino acid permease